MTDAEKTPNAAKIKEKPKQSWWRRILKWLGIFLLIVAIFHRPLFHFTVRAALRLAAARAHVSLDLHTSGTIFTNLTISGVKARSDGTKATPIRAIDIESVTLNYSIISLIKKGIGEFLHSYEIHHATLDLLATPSKDEAEKKDKIQIAKMLNNILGQPAAYADRVVIEDFNIKVEAPENVTEVRDFNLDLDPYQPGSLRIGRLAVPGVPVWENLSANTSYTNRNLFINQLQLAPELVLEHINFDASKRAQNEGSAMLQARLFGGTFRLALSGRQLQKSGQNLDNAYDTSLAIDASGIALDRLTEYFGAPKPPVQTLTKLTVAFTGEPEQPRTWTGSISAGAGKIAAGSVNVDQVSLAVEMANGVATITGINAAVANNKVAITGKALLPASVNEFQKTELDGMLQIDAQELNVFAKNMPAPLGGAVTGGGPITLHSGVFKTNLKLTAAEVANPDLGVKKGEISIYLSKQIDPPTESPMDALEAKITTSLTALRFQTFTADSARLEAEAHNQHVKVDAFELIRGENSVTADGTAVLPRDSSQIAHTPVDARFAIHVPRLGDFGVAVKDKTVTGAIEGSGVLKYVNGALNGGITMDGSAFALGNFEIQKIAAKVDVENGTAAIDRVAVVFNETNQIVLTGNVGLEKPMAYDAGLLVDLKNLKAFQPLLAQFGQEKELGGALNLQWNGKGQIDPQQHSGELALTGTKVKFDTTTVDDLNFAGAYTPEYAESKPFKIVSGPTSVGGVIEYRGNKLRLRDLDIAQSGTQVLTGFLYLPLNPSDKEQPIPLDQRLAANLNLNKLDLGKLLASFQKEAPVSGAVSANILAGGTPSHPFAHVKIVGERLQAKAAAQFQPANLQFDLHYADNELTLASTLTQPQIQPLILKGHAPLNLDETIKAKRLDPQMPIEASVQLAPSSLAFVPKVAEQVRRIDGTAAIDVRVSGTVAKPVFAGNLGVSLKNARMVNENIPTIGAFEAKLAFSENTLHFQRFAGELGGGTFKLDGSVALADFADPIFALTLSSKNVLVMRNDSLTVRADSDVKVSGPMKSGTVTGNVFLTQSRFFKEIDILPFTLPGKPKPAPKAVQSGPTVVSFPQPPIRDWKFDVAIQTHPNDPFLVRGNLANGSISSHLRLAGTGLEPYLEGTVNIDTFNATLPFSTLTISNGFVMFSKDAPFQPTLQIQADSRTRDYLVHAYVYGAATDPQVQLSSEPPLPHEDIVSLLATGTTASELASNPDALAGRAAFLAVQQLYRKVFKKGQTAPKEKDPHSFRDRFEFEVGALSGQSSGQEATARFRMTDQLYLVGDVGVDGNFTGRLKYLIRFR